MKKLTLAAIATLALTAAPAFAADMPVKAAPVPAAPASPWDVAFGGALMTDYNFRGISQSNRGPSVTAYAETRYNFTPNWQAYVGEQYWAVTLPTNPTCECDLYGGIRPTFGPWAFDFGFIYYWYPRERQHANLFIAPFPAFPNGNSTLSDTDYWEVYGRVVWEAWKDKLWFGGNVYYSPSWLNTGAPGLYASGTAKVAFPSFKLNLGLVDEVGWYASGEVGHYSLGTTDLVPGVFFPALNLPDYWTWNVGLAFTWKVFTLDVRYYDTDLSKENCSLLTGDPNATPGVNGLRSNWCSPTVIAKFSADLTVGTNLK